MCNGSLGLLYASCIVPDDVALEIGTIVVRALVIAVAADAWLLLGEISGTAGCGLRSN